MESELQEEGGGDVDEDGGDGDLRRKGGRGWAEVGREEEGVAILEFV